MTNPIAPIVVNGINNSAPGGYQDQSFTYVYDVTLTANQVLQGQVLSLYTYADFLLCAIVITVQTGLFSVRFTDGQGYYLSNVLIDSYNLVGTPSDPFALLPPILYPAGGKIGIDITEGSGATNVIEIAFVGMNRYRTK
jgi:hypothetical protein